MSASLVGSEMCIRDRVVIDRCPPLEVGPRFQQLRAAMTCLQSLQEDITACLLYTSDAADDM
eukprot:1385550-Alexandrium_andersonii.AAC.1